MAVKKSPLMKNRVVERKRMKSSELMENPANWRQHPEGQAKALAGILREVGQVGELYAYYSKRNSGKLVLIDGHLRLKEASEWDVAICDLTDEEADKVLLTRDPIAALATASKDALDSLLREVKTNDDGVAALLAGLATEAEIISSASSEPEESPEEPAGQAIAKTGQLWKLGEHRLLCGDSTDPAQVNRLLEGRKPFLQIVDPPFDLDYTSWPVHESAKLLYVWARGDKALIWMATLGLGEQWGVHTLCFTGAARGWARPEQPCLVHEVVYVLRRKNNPALLDKEVVKRMDIRRTEDDRHFSFCPDVLFRDNEMSWAKPVICMEHGLIYTPPASVVYDPCTGSGAVLLACERHGRQFCGVEMNPLWVDYAVSRWEKETGKKAATS